MFFTGQTNCFFVSVSVQHPMRVAGGEYGQPMACE